MKGIINAFGKIKTTTVLMTIAAICAVLLVALGVSELVKTKPEQDNSGSAEQEITAQEDMDDSGYFAGMTASMKKNMRMLLMIIPNMIQK